MKFISIQYLRAIAIFLVIFVHLGIQENKLFSNPIIGIFKIGTAGVDIFFIISGFIMMLLIAKKKERFFLLKRFIRIYPIYWFYLSILIFIISINPSYVNSSVKASYIRSILLLPSSTAPLLNVSWTLVYEMYFYMLISIVIYFFNSKKYLIINVIIISSIAIGLVIGEKRYIYPEIKLITSPMLLEFLFGMLIFRITEKIGSLGRYNILFLFISIFTFIYYQYNHFSYDSISILGTDIYDNRAIYFGIPAFFLVLGFVMLEKENNLPKFYFLKFIGDISYSLYLSHYFILVLLFKVFNKFIANHSYYMDIIFLFVSVVFSMIGGTISYYFIEKPIINYLNKKFIKC